MYQEAGDIYHAEYCSSAHFWASRGCVCLGKRYL